MEKIILTGGPGAGKSSIILALEQLGEYIIREVAEDYIKYRQASGVKEPWLEEDFQLQILNTQLQREKRIPQGIERIFLDRSLIDGKAYIAKDHELNELIDNESIKADYHNKVFLVELMNQVEQNDVRREDMNEAKILENKLESIYQTMGFEVIRIKPGPLKDRVAQVLNNN